MVKIYDKINGPAVSTVELDVEVPGSIESRTNLKKHIFLK